MISPTIIRFLVVVAAFMVGILLEYWWLGSDTFHAFGVVLMAFFVAPILILFINIENRLSAKKPQNKR